MNLQDAKRKLLQDSKRRAAYDKIDLAYEIGKMITDARISKNMTQQKLAKLVGTKQPSIARIEKGSSLPSLSFLQKIATAFHTQLLPPRLEFLEELRNRETESRTALVSIYPTEHFPSNIAWNQSSVVSETKNVKELYYAIG
jgi:transcriptional regulator with XRE-family HTH domain